MVRQTSSWEQALPLGNGRIGAMVFGGIGKEIIQLNEESIWAGPPVPEITGNISSTIDQARTLLFDGKYRAAQELMQATMPARISPRSYQTLGQMNFNFPFEGTATDYRRDLNLDTAIATTQFSIGEVNYIREVLACPVNQVIAVWISASKSGSISFDASVFRPGNFSVQTLDNTLVATGQASQGDKHKGVKFAAAYKAVAESGSVSSKDGQLIINNADAVTIYIAVATDYNRDDTAAPLQKDLATECLSTISAAVAKGYQSIKGESIAAHQKLFRRVELKLGQPSKQTTLNRLKDYRKKEPVIDPNLEALYFQYGRYLLITSSRPGCLPANLQGIWCKDLEAPWNSDYHININAQMNYWPAETCNLSECHTPFFDYLERLVPAGQQTAKDLYGCRGFFAGHTSDA